MMDRQDGGLERKECTTAITGPGDRNGCLPSWIGRINGRYNDGKSVVIDGEDTAYQSAETERRCICSESFHQREEEHPREAKNGQHNCSCLPQSHGRYEVPKLSTLCIAVVALVFVAWDHHLCRASAGGEECQSRSGVTDSAFIGRVDAAPSTVSVDNAKHGSMSSGPVCDTSEQPAAVLRQLAAESICNCYRHISDFVEISERICFSTFPPGGEVPEKDQGGEKFNPVDSSCLADPVLVPSAAGIISGCSNAVAKSSGPSQ